MLGERELMEVAPQAYVINVLPKVPRDVRRAEHAVTGQKTAACSLVSFETEDCMLLLG
jgi:hypothetical protein